MIALAAVCLVAGFVAGLTVSALARHYRAQLMRDFEVSDKAVTR